jgi:rSAM/selenodomain-associated transferase 1
MGLEAGIRLECGRREGRTSMRAPANGARTLGSDREAVNRERSAMRFGYGARVKRLGLFARVPVTGRVKTRLAPALPPDLACELYRGLLADAIEVVIAARVGARTLFVAGEPETGEVTIAAPPGLEIEPQIGDGLGSRLEHAFGRLLTDASDRAVIIGADCPEIEPAIIDRAFTALGRADVVLAPARDGGYALIGLARRAPQLFHGIDWSTDRVLGQTLARAGAAGLRVEQLETLDDLDTPEDLVRVLSMLIMERARAPQTRRALEAMHLLPAL